MQQEHLITAIQFNAGKNLLILKIQQRIPNHAGGVRIPFNNQNENSASCSFCRLVCQAGCEVIMQIKDDLQLIKSPTTTHIMDII